MFGASMDDWEGDITGLPAENLEWTFNLISPFMAFMGGGQSLRKAPALISESMIFPYFRGMVFCAKLTNKGGWAAIDEVYRDPPLSTEQILHPEKYREKPDYPMSIDLGTLAAGESWKEVGRNVLGEMQLGILLKKHGGKLAAAGWDGDRYAVFEGPKGKLGLVWVSTWDTEDDAREFLRGYLSCQGDKAENLGGAPKRGSDSIWRNDGDSLYVVERHGRDVIVIEGFNPKTTISLVTSAREAKKTELKPAVPRKQSTDSKSSKISATLK
jgi:hypothetical protein